MNMDSFFITTPIYYVNDKPHIGHAYTTLLADVLARYHRLLGTSTWFLTGTDEHGQKVQEAAQRRGVSPQQHVDEMVVPFQDLWKKLGITHDDFIRTTEERHFSVVQRVLQDLFDRGEIYKGAYEGWYCVPDERFFAEEELADGKCPACGRDVEKIAETNYFFRLSNYQEWLIGYIEDHPLFIQPDFRRNETLGFLRKPLRDLCISRPKKRLKWGIELPFDSDYVTYVWFDALFNYTNAVGYLVDDKKFAKWWPASCHLIGKDILTTHSVYWPAFLKAAGVEQPKTIFAHGFWLSGEKKMGKSLGNVVDPMEMVDLHGVDSFRYYMMAAMVLGQDATFTEEAFVARYNSDLANDLGNLLSRVMNMMVKNCNGQVPDPGAGALSESNERDLWAKVQAAVQDVPRLIIEMKVDSGIAQVIAVVRETNRYLEVKQPWKQLKEDDQQPFYVTLYLAAEVLRVVSGLLGPVMPKKMAQLRSDLGLQQGKLDMESLNTFGSLKPGTPLTKPSPLFPRIEMEKKRAAHEPAEKETATHKAETSSEERPGLITQAKAPSEDRHGLITYDDFSKLDLQTAKIMAAKKVPDTVKLLQLEVMMGNERRQIVAGIALHYEPEQLIGKTVIVVANLKPAKIRGVESRGMLLAAAKGESLRLVTLDGELSSGARVG